MRSWWADRSDAERFDVYTRGSLFVLVLATIPVAILFGAAEAPDNLPAAVASIVLLTMASVVGLRVLGRGLDHAVHGTAVPVRALWVYLVLAIAAGVASFIGYGAPQPGDPGTLAGGVLVALHIVAVLSPLLPWTKLVLVGLGLMAATGGLAVVTGAPTTSVSAIVWSSTFGTVGAIGGFRGSVWMLQIVWELDRARRVQADLAVAEERLRFSRDLHDVMGRNLSVIALRSDLAAELVRRGRTDEAVGEMHGVRGVAQDSLREMREVIHGYRAVDLSAELAGARSVLRAAGTSTKVVGDATSIPPDAQAVLSWVVREGTTNVIRHAEAMTCTFRVSKDDDVALLTITNDGVRHPELGAGSGLSGLSERLAAVGGALNVDRDQVSGAFTIVAQVPVDHVDRRPSVRASGASS